MTTTFRPARASLLVSCLLAALALPACADAGDPEASSSAAANHGTMPAPAGEVHVEASADLFADEAFAAHAEATAPGVSATIDVEAWGSATVDGRLVAGSTSGGSVVLEEVSGSGSVTIEGGVALAGRLVVDVPGVADYDGPIPGLEEHELRFAASRAVELLSAEGGAAHTDLATGPATIVELPGVDGRLVLTTAAGSFVETHLVAECASATEDVIEVRARLVTAGLLRVQPALELDAPLLGTQVVALAAIEVTIEGSATVVLRTDVEELADAEELAAAHGAGASLPACL